MTKIEIKSWMTGEVLFALECNSVKIALEEAVRTRMDFQKVNLWKADLSRMDLSGMNLPGVELNEADLSYTNFSGTNLTNSSFKKAKLSYTNFCEAILNGVDFNKTILMGANFKDASYRGASFRGAQLEGARNMTKIMGVEPGNYAWKRFDVGLMNHGYQFYVGLNKLRPGEKFANDERILCSFPGFHFGSRSWCAAYFPCRPLEARIRIPEEAKINEPWATDGKASADMIEIIQIFDTTTREDVTDQYRGEKGRLLDIII